ncbi:hypothetical protein KJY77_05080 [Canibacter sp. lx-72]|uniref:ZmpA/ZmpB/ZmpC family metallo-endopeptidase n=1 Tax=Canibacter zhuwentaonis TaxID=2837491 RepID=UPI001BDDC97E|nr:hypothetical protein [Canibacter zhuwentaonis]
MQNNKNINKIAGLGLVGSVLGSALTPLAAANATFWQSDPRCVEIPGPIMPHDPTDDQIAAAQTAVQKAQLAHATAQQQAQAQETTLAAAAQKQTAVAQAAQKAKANTQLAQQRVATALQQAQRKSVAELAEANKNITDIPQQISTQQTAKQQAQKQLEQLAAASEEAAANSIAAREALRGALSSVDSALVNDPATAERIKQRLAELPQEIAALDKQLKAAQQQQNDLITEIVKLQTREQDAQREVDQAQTELQNITAQQHETKHKLADLQQQVAKAREDYEKAATIEESKTEAAKTIEQEIKETAAAIAVTTKKSQELARQIVDLESELTEATTTQDDLREKLKTLTESSTIAQTLKEQLSHQIKQLQQELAQNETELAQAQDDHKQISDTIDKAKAKPAGQVSAMPATAPATSAQTKPDAKPAAQIQDAELLADITAQPATLFRSAAGKAPVRITEIEQLPKRSYEYTIGVKMPNGDEARMPVTSVSETVENGITQYKFSAELPGQNGTARTVSVSVTQTAPVVDNTYTSFASLLNAMQQNPAGNFKLGKNVYADEVPAPNEPSYLATPFTGTFDAQGFQIHGLKKPLFSELAGAQVKNLELTGVNIVSTAAATAALAQTSTAATVIEQVHVSGNIEAAQHVGAIVANASQLTATGVSMVGTITVKYKGNESNVGGLFGNFSGGKITDASFQGTINTMHGRDNRNRVGGIAGRLVDGSAAHRVYAGGQINNVNGHGQVGGLIGSLWSGRQGTLNRALSAMQVNGGTLIHGDTGFRGKIQQVFMLENESSGKTDRGGNYGRTIALNVAEQFMRDGLQLSRDARVVAAQQASAQFNKPEAIAERIQAYHNYSLLLPYADAATVVKAANKLDAADALVTKVLRSVTATANGAPLVTTATQAKRIDAILLHFSDGTVEKRAVQLTQDSLKSDGLANYLMSDALPYTPRQVSELSATDYRNIASELRRVKFDNIDIVKLYGADAWQNELQKRHERAVAEATKKNRPAPSEQSTLAQMQQDYRGLLYLRETIEKQRDQLASQITKVLTLDGFVVADRRTQEQLIIKAMQNKAALVLGLAYVNKWYDINFGSVNLRDALIFNPEYYGLNRSALDTLIRLGSSYNLLNPRNTLKTYEQLFAVETGHSDIATLLEQLRQQHTTTASFDDWFKQTTKAYILETPSTANPDANVLASDRFTKNSRFRNGLLPILTVSENSLFVVVNMTSVALGTFQRYYDATATTAADVPAKIAEVKDRIGEYAKKYRDYYDMWYRIGNEKMREKLVNAIPVWDGYLSPKGWRDSYGSKSFRAIEEFFGPIGRWYPANGTYGYSNHSETFMVVRGILNGVSTYTHEMVHNLDRHVFLGGEKTRRRSEPELYPTSLLQNPDSASHDVFGFNQADNFTPGANDSYLHNKNPDRFQSVNDLNEYFKGYFEALHLLENAEAEAILKRSTADQAKILARLGNHPTGTIRHLNSYDPLTQQDIEAMNLRSISDLVENSLMLTRQLRATGEVQEQNGYWTIPVLDPLYGTAESDLGITGESAFRRNAFELLAARGYEGGFVPYASDKYGAAAAAEGARNLPDTAIMPRIFEGQFTSLKDYKKDAYAQNKLRAESKLKEVTLNDFRGETITIRNYADLLSQFEKFLQQDFEKNKYSAQDSAAYRFKEALFSQFMRDSEEFRSSIFTDGKQQTAAPARHHAVLGAVADRPVLSLANYFASIADTRNKTSDTPPDQLTDDDIQQLQDILNRLTQEITTLTAEISEKQANLQNLRALHTQQEALLEQLRSDISEASTTYYDAEQKQRALTSQLELKREQAVEEQGEYAQLQQTLAEKTAQRGQLTVDVLIVLAAETAAKKNVLDEFLAHQERAAAMLAEVDKALNSATAAHGQKTLQLATLNKELQLQEAAAQKVMQEAIVIAHKYTETAETQKQLTTLEALANTAAAAAADAAAAHEKAADNMRKIAAAISSLEAQLAAANKTVSELQKKNGVISALSVETLIQLAPQVTPLFPELVDPLNKLAAATAALTATESKQAATGAAVREATAQRDSAAAGVTAAQQQLALLTAELNKLLAEQAAAKQAATKTPYVIAETLVQDPPPIYVIPAVQTVSESTQRIASQEPTQPQQSIAHRLATTDNPAAQTVPESTQHIVSQEPTQPQQSIAHRLATTDNPAALPLLLGALTLTAAGIAPTRVRNKRKN